MSSLYLCLSNNISVILRFVFNVLVLVAPVNTQYCIIDVGSYGRSSDGRILTIFWSGPQIWSSPTARWPATPGAEHQGPQLHGFDADGAFPLWIT